MLGDNRLTSNLLGCSCDIREGCPLNATCTRPQAKQHIPSGFRTTDPVDYLIIVDSPNLEDSYMTQAFSSAENSFFLTPLLEKGNSFAMSFVYRGHFLDKEHHSEELGDRSWNLLGKVRDVKNFGEFSRKIRTKSSTAAERKPVIQHCLKYMQLDIQRLRPKMIIAVGALVKDALFPAETRPVNKLFDEVLYYGNYPVRFITHPASLLRNKSSEKPWYEQFRAILTGTVVEKDTQLGEAKTLMKLDEVRDFIADLKKKQNDIAIDLETENLNKRWGNRIATIQFSENNHSGVVIPYHHKESPFLPEEIEIIKADLFDLFAKPSRITHWVGHNLKFECNLLHSVIGTPLLSAPMFDTQIGAFLVDECRRDRIASGEFRYGVYTLKQLCYEYLNFDGYNKEILEIRAEGNLFDLPLDALSVYGCIDTYKSRALMEAEMEEARNQDFLPQLLNLMYCFASPEILLFSKIEQNGFPIDRPHLRGLLSRDSLLLQGIKTIEQELMDSREAIRANEILLHGNLPKGMAPRVIPLGNTPFVFDMGKKGHAQTLFFKVLNLKPGKIGKNGLPSIDDEWQQQNLNNEYVKKYSEWSLYRHMYNTFASKMYNRIDPGGKDIDCNTDGHIRSNYLLSSAVTGRVISKEPNLQQIPRADNPAKRLIKDTFSTLPGHVMIQVDFKANEIRWAGIVSKDKAMAENFILGAEAMKAYKQNPEDESLYKKAEMLADIHKLNASSAFNIPIEKVTKDQRQQAKGCLAAGTLTLCKRGLIPIEDIVIGDWVWSGEKWIEVIDLWRPTSKIYRISTECGWQLDVSEDHKLLIYDANTLNQAFLGLPEIILSANHYLPIQRQFPWPEGLNPDLSGFSIEGAIPNKDSRARGFAIANKAGTMPLKFPQEMTEDLAWWLGALVAEGSMTDRKKSAKNNLSFTQSQKTQEGRDYFQRFYSVYEQLFGAPPTITQFGDNQLKASCSAYTKVFSEYCGLKANCYHQEVPWSILQANKTCQKAFINGYMAGDGSSPKTGARAVKAASASRKLIKQLQVVLVNFGICAAVRSGEHVMPKSKIVGTYWFLEIMGDDFDRYFEQIGETYTIKHRSCHHRHSNDFIPGLLAIAASRFKPRIKRTLLGAGKQTRCHPQAPQVFDLPYYQIEAHWKKDYELDMNFTDEEKVKIENLFETRPYFVKISDISQITETEETVYDLVLKDEDRKIESTAPYFLAGVSIQLDCTFGVLFDSSEHSIAEMYNMEVKAAKDMIIGFYKKHPHLYQWKLKTKMFAVQHGYVEAPHGRRRRLGVLKSVGPYDIKLLQVTGQDSAGKDIVSEVRSLELEDINTTEFWYVNPELGIRKSAVGDALRQATNAIIQGIASDSGMVGGTLFDQYIRENDKPWIINNAVHDSVIWQVPYADLEETLRVTEKIFTTDVMEYMTAAFGVEFNLPLDVDFEIGSRWGSLKGWKFNYKELPSIIDRVRAEKGET